MKQIDTLKTANKRIEGNVFYPTGHIIVAFDDEVEAFNAHRSLIEAGFSEDECLHLPGVTMEREAQAQLDQQHLLAALGFSLQILEKHLALAREGCEFLMIKVPGTQAALRARRVLARSPFRIAINYRHLVIDDIGAEMEQEQEQRERARV